MSAKSSTLYGILIMSAEVYNLYMVLPFFMNILLSLVGEETRCWFYLLDES